MAYRFFKAIVAPILRRLFKIHVTGLEHVPTEGPVILAPNHLSFIDSLFVPLLLDRRVTYVAKAEYFESWKTAWFFKMMGQIPVKRGDGSASRRALDSAADVLRAGGVFAIYPEGTRSPDGRLYKGRTGVARLALDCHAPVVAVGIRGTDKAQPIGRLRPRLFSEISVGFSTPLRFDQYRDEARNGLLLRQITDEIMFEIREVSGQEYVNSYVPKRTEHHEAAVEQDPVVVKRSGIDLILSAT